ncbi:Uncharacterised protein [Yersinia intermedia]|nr:Uncharacterised protein [Yersinia intermedia]
MSDGFRFQPGGNVTGTIDKVEKDDQLFQCRAGMR